MRRTSGSKACTGIRSISSARTIAKSNLTKIRRDIRGSQVISTWEQAAYPAEPVKAGGEWDPYFFHSIDMALQIGSADNTGANIVLSHFQLFGQSLRPRCDGLPVAEIAGFDLHEPGHFPLDKGHLVRVEPAHKNGRCGRLYWA
jgi:hypothetical protein